MKKYALIFLLIFISTQIHSQEKHSYSIWANVGGGISLSNFSTGNGGFLANYGLSASLNGWVLSLKHRNETEFLSFSNPNESFKTASLLFGFSYNLFKETRATKLMTSFSIGASFISITERGHIIHRELFNNEYAEVHHSAIGLPIELEMQFRFPKYFGFSIILYSDINSYENLLGYGFNLLVGKM